MNYYLSRLNYKFNKMIFNARVRKIRQTQPLDYQSSEDIIIMSMVHHAAIDMYLLAIKSFLYYFCTGSVYVLNDGSLTEEDIETLHLPHPQYNY